MKKGRKRNIAIISWFVILYIFSTHFILHKILYNYEMAYKPIPKGKVYECAIVLSGASSFDMHSNSLQFNEAAERITEPVILFRRGLVKKLLISGGSGKVFPPKQKEAVYVRLFWLSMGIPDSCILVESESRNTIENAKYSKELLEKEGIDSNILLITSALHAPRSKYIFEKQNIKVDYYPVDFLVRRDSKSKFRIDDHIIPKLSAIVEWNALIHEWVGLLAAKF